MIEIKIIGLEALQKRLDVDVGMALDRAMFRALAHLQSRIARYPRRRYGAKVTFVSAKQRRFFFWALREGAIQVPYRRTGTLGRRWTAQGRRLGGAAVGILGNITPYAPLVQDLERQVAMHKATGWPTVQGVVEQERDKVREIFQAEVNNLLRI